MPDVNSGPPEGQGSDLLSLLSEAADEDRILKAIRSLSDHGQVAAAMALGPASPRVSRELELQMRAIDSACAAVWWARQGNAARLFRLSRRESCKERPGVIAIVNTAIEALRAPA
jgi:hypothetical protein